MINLNAYKNIIAEYDDVIIGKKRSIGPNYFRQGDVMNERNALAIVQYAFVNYLKWTPEAIAQNTTDELIRKMHLSQVIHFVRFPIEYDETHDYYYLATLIFPQFGLSNYDRTIHMYERVLNKEIPKFPKAYFFGNDGAVRAGICLQYMINNYVDFTSINELYHIFGTDKGFRIIKERGLMNACRDDFYTPVDYLHFALPKEQRNDFFYYFYKFKYLWEMISDNGRKQHRDVSYMLNIPKTHVRLAEAAKEEEEEKPQQDSIWKQNYES